jgi:hypothetical protein
MRRFVAAATVALVMAGCGPSSDRVLVDGFDVVAGEGCEAVEWVATSEATSALPGDDRTHTLVANEDEVACGFGTQTWQRSNDQASESSPVAVIVVARRSSDHPPATEGDLVAHAAKQRVSGAGQAEASSRLISQRHILVAAVNEEHAGTIQPERLLMTAKRDLGIAE